MSRKPHLAGISFAVIFGFSFMFSKIALTHISPIGLVAYRFLIAFLMFELLRRLKILPIRLNWKEARHFVLVALFQPVLYFLFETYGLDKTTSSEAGMMIALIPIFVSLFSMVFLRERPKPIQMFFIVLSVSGILFIQISKSSSGIGIEPIGFILLLGAVVSAALFNIASRNASKALKPQELTYFMMMTGAIVFNGIYLVQLIVLKDMGLYVRSLASTETIISILYLGIIASIGGFFLVNFALGALPAHVASIYSNLSTIVAILAGFFLLREPLHVYHAIGSLMIIVGVYGTVRFNRRNNQKSKETESMQKGDQIG